MYTYCGDTETQLRYPAVLACLRYLLQVGSIHLTLSTYASHNRICTNACHILARPADRPFEIASSIFYSCCTNAKKKRLLRTRLHAGYHIVSRSFVSDPFTSIYPRLRSPQPVQVGIILFSPPSPPLLPVYPPLLIRVRGRGEGEGLCVTIFRYRVHSSLKAFLIFRPSPHS